MSEVNEAVKEIANKAGVAAVADGDLLPPGWISVIDPNSGKIYFANPATGESSWTIPTQ